MSPNRRVFLLTSSALALASTSVSRAQAGKVDPKDPQAISLGYVADIAQIDKKKYPQHASNQQCSSCALFQGKAGDAMGGCGVFGGKQVSAKGWCTVWAKKA